MKKPKTENDIIEYREVHAIIYIPDDWTESPITKLEDVCNEAGFEIEIAQIMDYDDEDEKVRATRRKIRRCLGVEYNTGE